MVDRLAILKRLAAEVFNPALPGPLNDLDTPQRIALGTLLPPLRVAGYVDRAMAGDEAAAQAITGAGLAANAQANPFLRLMPDSPGARAATAALAAFEQGDGGLVDRARAANEAGARGNEFAVGLINAVNSPSNLLGPLGAASKGTKAARLGAILTDIDRLQAMPVEALAGVAQRTGGKLARKVLSDRITPVLTKTTGKAGGVPLSQLAKIGGVRQYGPIMSPSFERSLPPPLSAPVLPPMRVPGDPPPFYLGQQPPSLPSMATPPPLIADDLYPKGGGPRPTQPPSPLTARVAALVGDRAPLTPAEEVRAPFPALVPREQRIAAALAKLRPVADDPVDAVVEQATEAAPLPQRAPVSLPSGRDRGALLAGRMARYAPPEAVSEAEERAARELPTLVDDVPQAVDEALPALTGTREELLGGLSGQQTRTLLGVAYRDVPKAISNAQAKYSDPLTLRERAIKRIQTGKGLAATLAQRDPELARLVGALPEPAAVVDEVAQAPNVDIVPARGTLMDRDILPEGANARAAAIREAQIDRDDILGTLVSGGKLPHERAAVVARGKAAKAELFEDAADVARPVVDETEQLRREWRQGIAQAIERGADDEVSGMLEIAGEYGYPAGEASRVLDELQGGAAGMLDQQIELIEASPYFQVFKHFNPNGELKRVNPLTGQRLIVREGGKISKGRAEVWNIPGSGYDDVAAEAMASVGGYNASNAPPAEDFWTTAQQAFKQYQQLKRGTEIAPSSFAGDIAAGGGGGGGMGIVPLAGGLQLVPPLNGPVPNALRKVAADVAENVGAIAGLARESVGQGVQANADALAGTTSGKFLPNPKQLYGYWKRTTVEHPKNLLQDETWVRLVTRALQGKEASDQLAPLRREMQGRLRLAGNAALPQSELDDFAALGIPNHTPRYGGSLAASERQAADDLNAAQRVVSNVALSVVNPSSVVTTPLGLVASGLRGAVDAGWSGFFQSLNGVLQQTGRIAIARSERGQALAIADDLLRQRYGIADGVLPAGGRYSPEQVAQVAGKEAGEHWKVLRDTSVEAGEARARALLGDYSDEGKKGWEKALGGAVPFASWAVRSYPVIAQMALQHPLVAIGIYHYLSATKAKVEEGQPSYTAGMIPVDAETPFVGLLARYLLGGAEGVAYIDPVGSFSPVGGEVLQGDDGSEKNWYQGLNAGLGRVGLPSLGPGYQAAAFATGLDYKSPNFGSRTRGIEEAAALLPLNPQLPNAGAAALTGLRRVVSPLAEGVLPGAKGDKYAEQYDPLTRRYNELVIAETGKPLTDPSNAAFLQRLADPNDPLVQQARREVLLGGAARNATSLTSPIATVAQTDENRAYRAAAKGMPFTYATVDRQRQAGTKLADYMDQRNAAYRKANPAADTYRIGNREDAAWEQLRQWEEANKDFKFVVSATAYNRALRKKKEELGLIEPEKKTGTR